MIARYSTDCPLCDDRIVKGRSKVERLHPPVNGRRWAHARCADNQPLTASKRALAAARRPRRDLE
jgi:hypothetical protein